MDKRRSISTSIWGDTWFEDLEPTQKLLFLYFLTNERTNMLGVYEISTRKVSFETGISQSDIEQHLKGFESDKKIRYVENRVIILNYLKHQKFNKNMKISALKHYNELPEFLKIPNIKELDLSEDNASEGFETLVERFGRVRKIEKEIEVKSEGEIETEYETPKPPDGDSDLSKSNSESSSPAGVSVGRQNSDDAKVDVWPTFDDFWDAYDKKMGREPCEKKWKKLKQSDKEAIMQHVPIYVEYTPDKAFRKNPQTYLNQKTWEDEEIINQKPKSNGQFDISNLNPKEVAEYVRAVRRGEA